MGILQKKLVAAKNNKRKPSPPRRASRSTGNTPNDLLDYEIIRISKYIDQKYLDDVLDFESAKRAVLKIGSAEADTHRAFGYDEGKLLYTASKKSINVASRELLAEYADINLAEEIVFKSGKKGRGKKISDDIYLKKVQYMRKGKKITYIQARSIKTGRVVKWKK